MFSGLSEKVTKLTKNEKRSSLVISKVMPTQTLNTNYLLNEKRASTESSLTPEPEFFPSDRNWSSPNFLCKNYCYFMSQVANLML